MSSGDDIRAGDVVVSTSLTTFRASDKNLFRFGFWTAAGAATGVVVTGVIGAALIHLVKWMVT